MYYGIVYCVTNGLNDMKYIGATKRTLQYVQRRFNGRQDSYRDGPVFRAIKEFGPEAFSIRKLGDASSERELVELKTSFIERYDTLSPNGYNERRPGRYPPTSVVCLEKGVIYASALQAADAIGGDVDSLLQALHTGEALDGLHWNYVGVG